MIVSKAFWKIVLKNIGTIILYTGLLVLFGTMNMSSNTATQFEATKPDVVVFNHDEENALTKHFVSYLEKNAEIHDGFEDDDKLKDALFYEEVVLVVDIPEKYGERLSAGEKPELNLRSSAGYSAEVAKVMVQKYLRGATAYALAGLTTDEIIKEMDSTLGKTVEVQVQSTVDSGKYGVASRYFSFANYSILACVITIICLVMGSFNRLEIRKRNLVSAIELKNMNAILLRNCCIYAFGLWVLYAVMSLFTVGTEIMLSMHGIIYLVNAFVFCICAVTLAYLLSKIVSSRGAVSGMMNVVAIGSSFLCGAFVPAQYLPDSVLAVAHVLPSYYYIDAGNKVAELPDYSFNSLWPIIFNVLIVLGYAALFVVISNIISKKKQRIA